jgi:chromosome segregation ATPase
MTISDMILSKPDPVWKQGCEKCAEKDEMIAELEERVEDLVRNCARAWSKFDEAMTGLTRLQLEAAEQIAALQARVKELELDHANTQGVLEQRVKDRESRINILTEALENTLLCSDAPSCHRIARAALGGKEDGC